ncbi:MAG: VOC family protein [Chloroflexota bacterium]|nr:VOC family protein [Chloroflexota bacterium]MDE2910525.1 VOC family protein [Chloroflexota bacterium]
MFKRLAHVCIGATDLAATEHFYIDLLGMDKAFDFYRDDRQIGFYLRAGESTFIEVFVEPGAPQEERPLIRHFCLEVDDLEGAIAALKSKGIEVSEKKLGGDGAWQAWITDPAGIRIELMQYGQASSQFSGRRVELS